MNNGIMLRAINIQRCKYNRLETVFAYVGEYIPSLEEKITATSYLVENGYLHTLTNEPINKDNYLYIEVKVTAKGIRLLAGAIENKQVEV